MQLQKRRIGEKEVMPFTIPSGIIMTDPYCAARLLAMIPQIGIWTTKTITLEARLGYREPITAQVDYLNGTFVNAVGLANPGAEAFARVLSQANVPQDRAILASIGGSNAQEFIEVARILEDRVDAFELNLSCPHVQGHGMSIGMDPKLVYEIVKALRKETKKPIYVKLTPQATNIGEIAKAAIEAGAQGIVAVNTAGPGLYQHDGHPVLSNKVGGLSGKYLLPIGLRCVEQIRQAVGPEPLIIGMGGISTAQDIIDYHNRGARAWGIGTAVVGMRDIILQEYFHTLQKDLENRTNHAQHILDEVEIETGYRKVELKKREQLAPDLFVLKTDYFHHISAGQFVFAWIPGVGEKPFSVMGDNPLTLGIQERGECTKALGKLREGESFYIRGPYGTPVRQPVASDVVYVGGGSGIFGLHALVDEANSRVKVLLGARDASHLPHPEYFQEAGDVYVATEDGSYKGGASLAVRGQVTSLFRRINLAPGSYFYNCGPKGMIDAVLELEQQFTSPDKIFTSADFMTKCGLGLCGSCANERGVRTCIEGPFMRLS